VLEAAFGQAEGYIDQYFAKASYKFDIAGSPLSANPGPFQTQIQHIGRFIAKGDRLQPRGAVVDVVDAAVADFIAMVVSISGGITAPTLTPTARKQYSSARCMT
jgi:hypothetical protein